MRQQQSCISLFVICILYLLCVSSDSIAEDGSSLRAVVGFIGNKLYLILWIPFVALFIYLVHLFSKHLKLIATLSIFSQYHTQETISTERNLYATFCETAPDFKLNPHNLEKEVAGYVTRTLRMYERLGLLIRKGGVNEHAMLYLIGDVCIKFWLMLEQHIRTERERGGDRFWHLGVEYLAMLSLNFHIKNKRGELTIYHPDEPENKDKGKTYTTGELTKKFKDIKAEMKKMKKVF